MDLQKGERTIRSIAENGHTVVLSNERYKDLTATYIYGVPKWKWDWYIYAKVYLV